MGMCKNTDPDDSTSMETNASQSRDQFSNQPGEQFVEGAQGGTEQGCLNATFPPAEDEVIPWKFVPQAVVRRLVQKLNPENLLSGNNWKALAGVLGFNSEQIRFIESVQRVHSEFLLDEFSAKPEASVNEMLDALRSIKRKDCIEIICDALPEIRQTAQNSINSRPMAEVNSTFIGHNGFGWSNGAVIVPAICQSGSSRLMSMTHPPSNLCCMHGHIAMPCSHVTASHGENSCNMFNQGMSSFSSASVCNGTPLQEPSHSGTANRGGILGAGYCSVAGKRSCVAGVQQQWNLQPARLPQENYGELGCMQMDTALSENISPMHGSFNVTSNNIGSFNTDSAGITQRIEDGCEISRKKTLPMDCGDSAVRQKTVKQLSDEGKPDQSHYHYDKKLNKHAVYVQSTGHRPCQHYCGDTKPVQSMMPTTPLISQTSGICCSHSSEPHSPHLNHHTAFVSNCGEERETVGRTRKPCNPTLPSSPLKEHKPSLSSFSSISHNRSSGMTERTPPMSSNINSDEQNRVSLNHRETGVSGRHPAGYGFNPKKQNQFFPERQGEMWNTPSQNLYMDMTNDGGSATHEDQVSSHAHSAAGLVRPIQGNSLSSLEKMEAMRDKYKPSSKYQTIVAKQKIESESMKTTKDKDSKSSVMQNSIAINESGSGFNSLSSYNSDSHPSSSSICSASQTFPMRVKVRHERDGRGGQGGVVSGGMSDVEGSLNFSKKSVSMPKNMKPQSYRKAWRGIKVFVTYSMDNPSHNDQVLCLGYFLKNNGFNCYLDTPFKRSKTPETWQEHVNKFHQKFCESDFVLVCISPKYLHDVSVSEPDTREPRLHTFEIYQFMKPASLNRQAVGDEAGSEVCERRPRQSSARSAVSSIPLLSGRSQFPQVVPVLFGSMTPSQIPPWMLEVGVPCKRWEADYADLAWLLTKPQSRIRPSRQPVTDTGRQRF